MPSLDDFPQLPGPYPVDSSNFDLARQVYANRYRPVPSVPAAPAPTPLMQSTLTDLAHGVARGFQVEVPRLVGGAAEAFGAGDYVKGMRERAEARGKEPGLQVLPGGWGEAAAGVVPALGLAAAAPLLGAVGVPAAAAGLGVAGLTGALYGGSTYTEALHKLQGEGIDQGTARAAALGEGVVMGAGQAILNKVTGGLVGGVLGRRAASTVQGAMNEWVSPGFVGPVLRGAGIELGTQALVQPTVAAGLAGIERAAGSQQAPTPWEAAKESVAPALMMATLMAPFGGAGTLLTNRTRARAAEVIANPKPVQDMEFGDIQQQRKDRLDALGKMYGDISRNGPEQARAWRQEATDAIYADQPVVMDVNWKFERPATATPPPPAPLSSPYPNMEGEFVPGGGPPPGGGGGAPGGATFEGEFTSSTSAPVGAPALPPARTPFAASPEQLAGPAGVPRLPAPPPPLTYEQRAVLLKQEIPTINRAKGILPRLVDKDGEALAAELRAIWVERDGGADPAKYMEQIDAYHKKLTGKSIDETLGLEKTDETAGRTAETTVAGTEPQPTTATAGTEIAGVGEQATAGAGAGAAESAAGTAGATTVQGEGQAAATIALPGPLYGTETQDLTHVRSDAPHVVEARQLLGAVGGELPSADALARLRALAADFRLPDTKDLSPQQLVDRLREAVRRADSLAQARARADVQRGVSESRPELQPGEPVPYGAFSQRVPTQEELNALETRQEPAGGEQQREGTGGVGTTAAAGGGNRFEQFPPLGKDWYRAEDGTWRRQGDAAAVSEAEARVIDTKEKLDAKQAELVAARREMSQLNEELFANPLSETKTRQINAEQQARRTALKERIDALLAQRDQLHEFKLHSDAVAAAEKVRGESEKAGRGGAEPAETIDYWDKKYRHDIPVYMQGDILHSWLTLLLDQSTKERVLITPEQKKIREAMQDAGLIAAKFRPTVASKEAQRLVHEDYVKTGQDKELNRAVEQWYAAHQLAKEVGLEVGKAEDRNYAAEHYRAEKAVREANEQSERHASDEERVRDVEKATRLDEIAQQLETGQVSQKEASRLTEQVLRDSDPELQAKRDARRQADREAEQQAQAMYDAFLAKGRGIEGYSDPALAARVAANPSALQHMADIARHHRNPIVRAIARLLSNDRLTASIVAVENPDFKGARYVPATDTIEVGQGGMNTLTLMHETLHALTHKLLTEAISHAGLPFDTLTKAQQAGVSALREVRALMERFSKVANFDDPAHRLAMKDEHEFMAEAMANPSVQHALDSRGWLSKIFHKIANAMGFDTKMAPEVERLLRAASALFGDPNAASKEVYRRDLELGGLSGWFNSLASISPKLAFGDFFLSKDLPGKLFKMGLKWLSLNHMTHTLLRNVERGAQMFGPASPYIRAFGESFASFRHVRALGDALSAMVTQEGSRMNARVARFAKDFPLHMEKLAEIAFEGTRLDLDPAARSFEAAKKRNPDLTREQYDAAAAQHLRAQHAWLEAESARMLRADPKADTPIKLYNDMLAHNTLNFTRHMAQAIHSTLQVFDLYDHPALKASRTGRDVLGKEYDRLDVLAEPYRRMSVKDQQFALNKAIDDIKKATTKTLADKLGVAEKDVDKTYEQLRKTKSVPKDVTDLLTARDTVNDILGHYAYHQKVPYFHLGRTGDYVIKMTVTGGQAEWDKVGAIIGGAHDHPDPTKRGLDRGWGPPKGENRDVYMRFDNELLFKEAVARLLPLKEQGLFNHPETGESTWAADRVDESHRQQAAMDPQFIRTLENRINRGDYGPESAEIKRQLVNDMREAYIASLPESSPLKAKMFRDGDVGYSKDFVNTFADRLTMSKGSLVSAYMAPRMAQVLKGMHEAKRGMARSGMPGMADFVDKMGLYSDELRGRMADLSKPVQSPVWDWMRTMPAAWRLMLAPAYMVMVALQPFQFTLPALGAKYGYVKTVGSMIKNYGKALSILNALLKMGWADPNLQELSKFDKLAGMSALQFEFSRIMKKNGQPMLTGHDLHAMEGLQWSSLLNFGQISQIARMNPEEHGVLSKVAKISTVAPHYIETVNRMVTMLTAHELEMARSGDLEAARKQGIQTVRDTDGDHSQSNIARNLGRRGVAGPATPLMVGFGQFAIQQTEKTVREIMRAFSMHSTPEERKEATKYLAGLTGTTSLVAGVLGLPFVSLLTFMGNSILSLTQDSNDDPPDVQGAVRQGLANIFGEKGGEIVAHGISRAPIIDIDMSSRSGLQDIAPFSEFLTSRRKIEDRVMEGGFNLLGPGAGVVSGLITGLHAGLVDHNYPKLINDALPAQLRNLAKAYRLSKYGYESMAPGNQQLPIPVSAWNIAAQAGGFTSARRAEVGEAAYAYHTQQELLQARQATIHNDINRAWDHGDYEGMSDAIQQSVDFQMRHPQMGMDIGGGLKQRALEKATAEFSGTGILAAPRMYPQLQKFNYSGQ